MLVCSCSVLLYLGKHREQCSEVSLCEAIWNLCSMTAIRKEGAVTASGDKESLQTPSQHCWHLLHSFVIHNAVLLTTLIEHV